MNAVFLYERDTKLSPANCMLCPSQRCSLRTWSGVVVRREKEEGGWDARPIFSEVRARVDRAVDRRMRLDSGFEGGKGSGASGGK